MKRIIGVTAAAGLLISGVMASTCITSKVGTPVSDAMAETITGGSCGTSGIDCGGNGCPSDSLISNCDQSNGGKCQTPNQQTTGTLQHCGGANHLDCQTCYNDATTCSSSSGSGGKP